MVFQAWRLLV